MTGDNTGHGHVWLRPDGFVEPCGGPAVCEACAADMQTVLEARRTAGALENPDPPLDTP